MRYPTAIAMAVGVFLVIGYLIYAKPQMFSAPESAPDALAFPELVFASGSTARGNSATSLVSSPARTPPAGMKEYRSAAYRFSLFYPSGLSVRERAEGGGASTITFQNIEKAEGFQIFIVPHEEPQVSAQRFKQDVPSGVRESLTSIAVDGAIGAAFFSENAALGATREVWVVHGGFLYEVTTLAPLDAWLGVIMQSWRFTS